MMIVFGSSHFVISIELCEWVHAMNWFGYCLSTIFFLYGSLEEKKLLSWHCLLYYMQCITLSFWINIFALHSTTCKTARQKKKNKEIISKELYFFYCLIWWRFLRKVVDIYYIHIYIFVPVYLQCMQQQEGT